MLHVKLKFHTFYLKTHVMSRFPWLKVAGSIIGRFPADAPLCQTLIAKLSSVIVKDSSNLISAIINSPLINLHSVYFPEYLGCSRVSCYALCFNEQKLFCNGDAGIDGAS